ncbi:MAG: glycosyltransferase [Bacteroidales bacterium]|nr:glycosyltransferase [Bacteroidales bacterium]
MIQCEDYLVSVIVPVYNSKPYLKYCLDSLLNQTLESIEIIMVDDGSIDGSSIILDEYAKKYHNFKVIHQLNQGQGQARNSGVLVARGKYIGFVDSDDYVDRNMYKHLYSLISDEDADISVCKSYSVDKNGILGKPLDLWNKFGNVLLSRSDIENCDFLNNKCSPVLWDKLIRADIVKRHLSTSLKRGQDFVALIDYLSEVNKIAFTSARLYYYRHHSNSVMATPESDEVILTDFKTERVAVSKILSYFGGTLISKLYINRIIKEWNVRIYNYPNLKIIKDYIVELNKYI